ncbi:MAG: chromate efflux transporter [Verrucomicrobiota bacterium]
MTAHPTFREALRFWLKLGFISFGGPAGQIAIMQTELVERKKWIGQERFLHALNFCMILPGPEAQQLAIYCGWLLHGARGGITAGALFVLPSAFILWGLGTVYVTWGNLPWLAAFFYGLKPAVMAVVAAAVLRIGTKALRNEVMWGIAAAAFALIFFGHAPFPTIVLGAAAVGWLGGRFAPQKFVFTGGQDHGRGTGAWGITSRSAVIDDAAVAGTVRPTWGRAARVAGVCGVLWVAPLIMAGLWQGWNGTLAREGFFFSKAAMVTFGGAYAVLPYVGQQAVEHYGWLSAPQMLDGLAFAETTPGPLIMVLQFVGFLGGWNHPGALSPLLAATLGAGMTTWTTFVPCFLWIFIGAPHLERLRGVRLLNTALSAVTAAVVGVVLNLAVWFAGHVIFPLGLKDGDWTQTTWAAADKFTLAVGLGAFVVLHRCKANLIAVIATCGVLGLFWKNSNL